MYNQDVIEIFIDEQGSGQQYMELEVSPNNIIFDAFIKNDGFGTWNVDFTINYEVK